MVYVTQDALFAHLSAVLRKENAAFEEGAVRLIARRAAGSVRDSMSLLDQTLALGGAELTVAVRPANGAKCLRCWKFDTAVGEDGLCPRCAKVLG